MLVPSTPEDATFVGFADVLAVAEKYPEDVGLYAGETVKAIKCLLETNRLTKTDK